MDDTNRSQAFHGTPAHKAGVSSFLVFPTEANLKVAAEQLRAGKLVAIPTETVYGLAADATQPDACGAIFAIKGRPLLDPLIIHVRDLRHAEEIAVFDDRAREIANHFWPGALTLVLPKRAIVPSIVTAGKSTVAVRCPAHPVFQTLARFTERPLAAPSANPFGYISPTRADHVLASFPHEGLPIIDGGPCQIGLESTIIDLTDPLSATILRAGKVTEQALSEALGANVRSVSEEATDETAAQRAPGMLHRHYSPHKTTHLIEAPNLLSDRKATARVLFKRPTQITGPSPGVFWLSENGDPDEAGQGLYSLMRQLDEDPKWREILIEIPPSSPQTAALLDRLRRAAAR